MTKIVEMLSRLPENIGWVLVGSLGTIALALVGTIAYFLIKERIVLPIKEKIEERNAAKAAETNNN